MALLCLTLNDFMYEDRKDEQLRGVETPSESLVDKKNRCDTERKPTAMTIDAVRETMRSLWRFVRELLQDQDSKVQGHLHSREDRERSQVNPWSSKMRFLQLRHQRRVWFRIHKYSML